MSEFKAALFDLDGTLIDTEDQYTEFWERIGKQYCPEGAEVAEKIKGTTLKQTLSLFFPDTHIQEKVVRELNAWEAQMHYEFYPDALRFIQDLKNHHVTCAIVTSSNKLKMANVVKQISNFNQIFDKVLTSENFSASKPNPDCYIKAAIACGCERSECIVFEDAFTGLQAGRDAGIFTIGLSMSNGRDAITDKCDYVLDGYKNVTYETILKIRNERY